MKFRRGHQTPWYCSYRWMWDATWVTGIQSVFSAKVTSVPNCWATSLNPNICLFYVYMYVPAYMYVCVSHVGRGPKRSTEHIKSHKTHVISSCEQMCRLWKSNPDLLQKQRILLTFKLFPYPQKVIPFNFFNFWFWFLGKGSHCVVLAGKQHAMLTKLATNSMICLRLSRKHWGKSCTTMHDLPVFCFLN